MVFDITRGDPVGYWNAHLELIAETIEKEKWMNDMTKKSYAEDYTIAALSNMTKLLKSDVWRKIISIKKYDEIEIMELTIDELSKDLELLKGEFK